MDVLPKNSNCESPSPENPLAKRIANYIVIGLAIFGVFLIAGHLLNQELMNRASEEAIVRYDQPTFRLRHRLLNLDREMSLPAWFSSILIAVNALLVICIAWTHKIRKENFVYSWLFLGLLLTLMSIDESVAGHEVLVNRVRYVLGDWATGLLYYAWYLPCLLLGFFIFVFLLPLIKSLPTVFRRRLCIALAIYFTGAIGAEALMGMSIEFAGTDEPPLQSPPMKLVVLVVLEEGLEILGMLMLFSVLLRELLSRISIRVL